MQSLENKREEKLSEVSLFSKKETIFLHCNLKFILEWQLLFHTHFFIFCTVFNKGRMDLSSFIKYQQYGQSNRK